MKPQKYITHEVKIEVGNLKRLYFAQELTVSDNEKAFGVLEQYELYTGLHSAGQLRFYGKAQGYKHSYGVSNLKRDLYEFKHVTIIPMLVPGMM